MRVALFDLDYTLYDAQKYLLGAFGDISKYIFAKHEIPEQKVYMTLVALWREKTSMYPCLFDDLLNLFHLDLDNLKNIVKLFNKHDGNIELYPDAIPTLRALKRRQYKLGIITDGNIQRQKRKIEMLKLRPFFDIIIYSKEMEAKPSSSPFLAAVERLKVEPPDSFYIGDNPVLDFKGAKKIGIKTIRILRGEFAELPKNDYIDFEITELHKLLEITEAN